MNFFYTPLEQFDEVRWVSQRVVETLEPYGLFISEREFDANQLYVNSYGVSSSTISTFSQLRQGESTLLLVIILIALVGHFAPIMANQTFSFAEGFNFFFFLAAINVFTGFFVRLWFTDFFFIQEEVSSSSLNSFKKVELFSQNIQEEVSRYINESSQEEIEILQQT